MIIEGLHVGQEIPVWYCDRIEMVVVSAGAPGAVLLGHQVQRGRVANKNNCFLYCEELLLRDTVLLQIQPPQGRAKTGAALPVSM